MPIREVQGTGAVSPLQGQTVTVEGVVTADWREGGFNGFVLQDPAGDPADGASDAVFVWGNRARAEIGQSVRVTGAVSEYNGLTEITVDALEVLPASLGEVAPVTDWAAIATPEGKEAHESELVLLNDQLTVTDNYDANYYGTFTLAYGDEPLRQPTADIDPHDTAAIAAATADNTARSILLDDAKSTNYNTASNRSIPFAYLTPETPVSVGSHVDFVQPFVLDYRYDAWSLQPTTPVTGDGSAHVTFSDVRAANAAREDVGGDLAIATFNVLNYFPTTAEEYVELGLGSCTTYNDRDGNPISANDCGDTGPRGAATTESFERQETKIVNAISALDASIVSLEEIENSAHFGKDRDFAVATLVAALNEKDGAGVWAYAPSPAAVPASEDVIRNAFIYRTADVERVGESVILTDEPAFSNARQPLFQAFKAVGADDADAFLVAANHFKSKGSGTDDGTGQGNANPDRVAQAPALVAFTAEVQAATGIEPVFLAGDFNAYAAEDPARVIEAGGYTNLNYALNGGEATYNYDGLNGSLDHVFANAEALELVTGVDVWQINAQEQIAFEYSRYNYNATLLYDESVFRASDHNPIVVGLDLPEQEQPEEPGQPGTHPGQGHGVDKGDGHPGKGKGVDKGEDHPGKGWKKRV
ncbi:ExeM/NucH family extracellular endonuclease [Microbacterium sediminis]|uniref:ExeM/NucH family extracellular endonuclease n=1 Tax=Microbacterium sediminis TaxID=904291 RepID=UPI0011464B34|nr:ExeM/NucH family extracellular endonuclease [Microbacterium sediminis]